MARHADIAGPEAAWARSGGADGLRWLERAARLAPQDPRIALDLALKRLDVATLAELAVTHDVAAAWLGLALARHRHGDGSGAAAALSALLERHCIAPTPGFTALADQVAQQTGYDGWQGMTAAGALLRHGTGNIFGAPDRKILCRVEGLVEVSQAGLSGWAARPAAPLRPDLFVHDATGARLKILLSRKLAADETAPFLSRYRFRLGWHVLRGLTPPFRVAGPDGTPLAGSPADPAFLALTPVAAKTRGPPPGAVPEKRPLCVVVPVYRGFLETKACLDSLFGAVARRTQIIVVDDATPEPALAVWLDQLAAARRIVLRRQPKNLGFPAAANAGIAAAGDRDVLLLNSDTLIPPGAIATLRRVAYTRADTGSVTPFSNAATILSYPRPEGGNALPDLKETIRLDRLARRANRRQSEEIPTGVGFCLYLRHDALKAVGPFRATIFAQGYGEENDWCLRARQAGFAHRAATGAYVAHIGGVSFGAAAAGLRQRNLRILERLYPGYHRLVMAHIAADPLRPARARLDAQHLAATQDGRDSVLLITHSHGDGVARREMAERQHWRRRGFRPLLLRPKFPKNPERTPYPWPAMLSEPEDEELDLVFSLPRQKQDLQHLLRMLRVRKIVLHHLLGHDEQVGNLAAALGVKQTIVIHDYASFCPRVNFFGLQPPAHPTIAANRGLRAAPPAARRPLNPPSPHCPCQPCGHGAKQPSRRPTSSPPRPTRRGASSGIFPRRASKSPHGRMFRSPPRDGRRRASGASRSSAASARRKACMFCWPAHAMPRRGGWGWNSSSSAAVPMTRCAPPGAACACLWACRPRGSTTRCANGNRRQHRKFKRNRNDLVLISFLLCHQK